MKNPITKMQLCTAISPAFFLLFISQARAQYFPDEGFDTTGIVLETVSDGIDTIWYYGDEETDSASEGEFRLGLNDSISMTHD